MRDPHGYTLLLYVALLYVAGFALGFVLAMLLAALVVRFAA